MALAAVGLGTFWSVTVAGQDLARESILRVSDDPAARAEAAQRAKFAYGILQTAGGGLGLLAFGPLSARFGRRRTFTALHLLAFLVVPLTCFGPQSYPQLLWILPLFGFLTLGMHAGYASIFPSSFPPTYAPPVPASVSTVVGLWPFLSCFCRAGSRRWTAWICELPFRHWEFCSYSAPCSCSSCPKRKGRSCLHSCHSVNEVSDDGLCHVVMDRHLVSTFI